MSPPAQPALPEFLQRLPHGITVVDTGFERARFDAAYLLVDRGRAAFVDTGHNAAVPRLLAALQAAGLGVEAVDWVIPTHVHLDHAGGAGLLMQHLPNARLLKHPRGAPHMIDPGALIAGAEAVYGAEAVARTYGVVQPVPEERVVASDDGMTIMLGSRPLTLIHTPGHARHHHCIWDEASRGWFTGDTFGIAYRELDTAAGPFIFPTTTPVQFEPQPLRESIARLMQRAPEVMYVTHFGPLHGVPRLAEMLLAQIDDLEALARRLATIDDRHAKLREAIASGLIAGLRRQGSPLGDAQLRAALAIDIELNAQGVGIWIDRQQRPGGAGVARA